MRHSTASCIFGTVAKKCRGTLEELLCFFAGSCAISAALRKRQSFFAEISYKETQPGRFLMQISLAKPPEI